MSLPALHSALPTRKLPVWGACLLMAALLASASHAQRTRGKKAPAQPLPPPVLDRNASRFILPENQQDYLNKMLSRMSMTKRAADPFGRSQDPDAAPAIIANPDPARARMNAIQQKVPLQQVVALLKVSTVIPGEKRFIIRGGRSFQVGDTIPLTYRAKSIKAEVASVNSSQISFRDTVSGETATLEMKLLPPGMEQGAVAPGPPGLFRNDKEAHINLDAP